MIIVKNKIIPFGGFDAMTLGPFVFTRKDKDKVDAVLLNHESIHWEQQKELLILPFFLLYGLLYVVELIHCLFAKKRGQNPNPNGIRRTIWKRAYRSIIFEREAYGNQENMNYLKERKFWGFLKYAFQ